MPKRLALSFVAAAGLVLLAAACGGNGEKTVTGRVLSAVERNLAEIETLTLRGEDGNVWKFVTEGPVGTSAAHLRQHQLGGEPVIVTYHEANGRLVATHVRDAAGPHD